MKRSRQWSGLAMVAALFGALIVGMVGAPAQAQDRSRAVSGWFGYWTGSDDMISIARSSRKVLGEVNIFWWKYAGPVNPVCTTTLACPSPSSTPHGSAALLAAAKGLRAQGVDVYATHTDLDSRLAGSLSQYLSTKKNRRTIAKRLTEWAVASGVTGVDLDWENFAFNDGSGSWGATRPRLTATIKILSKKLHAAGLKLSVTVPGGYQPFRSNGTPNPGGGYSVFDWAAMAPYVDRLRLMTYDYSWNRPGPIGPHRWSKDAVRSAVAQVGEANRSKIYVGLHQYGKAWYARDAADDYVTVGACDDRWEPVGTDAISLSVSEARELAADYGVTPRFDKASREWTYSYVKTESGRFTNDNGKRRTRECQVRKDVWFGAKETAVGRMKIVKKLGIGGVAIWQLAGLDTGFFAAVKPYTSVTATNKTRRKAGS